MNLKALRKAFVSLQLGNREAPTPVSSEPVEAVTVELNPVEQKHAIARAKAGEFKSLKKVFAYKTARLLSLESNL